MMRKIFKYLSLAVISISAINLLGLANPASAKMDATNYNAPIIQKSLLTVAYKCFSDGAVSGVVEKLSGFSNFGNIVSDSTTVWLPTGMTPITNGAPQYINCKSLFAGDAVGLGTEPGTFEGIFKLANKTISSNTKDGKIALLENLGYTDAGYTEESAEVDQCINFTYNETFASYTKSVTTENVCGKLDGDGKIIELVLDPSTANYTSNMGSKFFVIQDGKIRFARATKSTNYHGYTQTTYKDTTKGVGDKWDDFVSDIKQTAATEPTNFRYTYSVHGTSMTYDYALVGNSANGNTTANTTGDSRYEFAPITRSEPWGSRGQKAGIKAINYLATNGATYSSFADLAFTPEERLHYYFNVLLHYYFEGADAKDFWKCNVEDWSNYSSNFNIEVKYNWGTNKQSDCKLNSSYFAKDGSTSRQTKKFTAFYHESAYGDDKYFFGSTEADFDFLINDLNSLAGSLDLDDTPSDDANVQNQDSNMSIADICMNESAADNMSWLVCTPIDGMAQGGDGIYGAIKDLLNIDATLLSTTGETNETYTIWAIFRDMANIIFVIFILIVIFSQVTGFGIDNYGIKKMLPRLIATAILVNLSFIVCQLAVDLSNIIGNSLGNWMSAIAANAYPDVGNVKISDVILAIFGSLGAAGAASSGIIITVVMAVGASWWLILIIVGIILLIILIAVIVIFLMLGARQLIVIVAVAIAPLALICYALPNTEKLFKKWLTLFKAALFMYPICSALNGVGQIIQAIVFGANGGNLSFAMSLIACIAPFLPFLALPSLLKGSMAAAAGVGGLLMGLGAKARGGLNRGASAARNTDAYKEARMQTAMNRNTARLNKFKNADGSWKDDSQLSDWQKRRKNLYQRRDLAFRKEDMERQNLLNGGYEAAQEAIQSAANRQALDNEITAMATATNNYDTDTMDAQLKDLLGKTSLTDAEQLRMKALMQKLATGSGYGKKLLAKTVAGSSEGTRAVAAKFMSKNADVASAISAKNAAAGQYLREVNSGATTAKSFDEWKAAERVSGGKPMGMSNMQFVMTKVTTEDADFVKQSAGVVAESLGLEEAADGSYVVNASANPANILSDDRLSAMVGNERLMDSADSDVRNAIISAAKARGLTSSIPQRYGGTAPATPVVAPSSPAPHTSTTTTGTVDIDLSAPTAGAPTVLDVRPAGSAPSTPAPDSTLSPEAQAILRPASAEERAALDQLGDELNIPKNQRPF